LDALEILKCKKGGNYLIIQADPSVEVKQPTLEFREIMGLAVAQPPNTRVVTDSDMDGDHIATSPEDSTLPQNVVLDLMVANVCLKYAQSNNVACAYQGQLVGLSAGQQSRVHSTRLACAKADVWLRRHHPAALAMLEQFRDGVKLQSRINATTTLAEDPYRFLSEYGDLVRPEATETVRLLLQSISAEFDYTPDLSMASDAFFPFPDSIHAANKSGVVYISQPGGSTRDEDVKAACSKHGMWMVHTGVRIFTH
jgi:AICAR transformylase/IMP cyclohydrolase PurH